MRDTKDIAAMVVIAALILMSMHLSYLIGDISSTCP